MKRLSATSALITIKVPTTTTVAIAVDIAAFTPQQYTRISHVGDDKFMSTSAILPNVGTSAALPLKYENLTFAVVVKIDDNGKITSVRHTQRDKDIANLESEGYPHSAKEKAEPETIAFKQEVRKVIVGSIDGFYELFPNVEHQLAIINKGVDQQFNQKIRTTLIEQDSADNLTFQPTDAPYDATPLVQDVSNRGVKLTEEEIAIKALSGLQQSNPEMFAAILAQFQKSAASNSAAE